MKAVPLLGIQRDLYNVDVTTGFPKYLEKMLHPNRRDIRLPLQNMNQMAKEHVPKLLNRLLDMDADGVASEIFAELIATATACSKSYSDIIADYPVDPSLGLVVVDDAAGGWNDRY